jgi:hypothetical protein
MSRQRWNVCVLPCVCKFVRLSLILCLVALGIGNAAKAQSQSTAAPAADDRFTANEGWHVDVAPYLWFPGVNGTVGAFGHQAGVSVTAGDVLSNFDFGLMGAVEIRHNRFLIPLDYMWVRLKDDKGIPFTDLVNSVNVRINEHLFTPKVGYRLVDKPRFKADVLAGLRYWHLGTTLTLQPQVSNGFYVSSNWVDAVEGARFQTFLTPKTTVTIAGDVGGGGSGTRLDYEVVGLLGYRVKRVTLEGGWRYLVIHRSPSATSFANLTMTGLVLDVVIPLK